MGWLTGLQAHGSSKPDSEVTVEHFATDRNPAKVHIQTHQAESLAVHRKLLCQFGADVQALGLGQVDEPGPNVGAGPVPGIDGQSIGTVVDLFGGNSRHCRRSDHRSGNSCAGVVVTLMMVMVAMGVSMRPSAITFVGQYADRG